MGPGWEPESSDLGRVVEPAKAGECKGDPQPPAPMDGAGGAGSSW